MYTSAATAVAVKCNTQMEPVAASMSNKRGNWKSVNVSGDFLIVTGGFNTKHEVVPSIRYQTGTITRHFVELDKNAMWFLKGAGGPKTSKGDLKAVQVLQEVRTKFAIACGCEPTTATAVAGGGLAAFAESVSDTQEADDDDDPMNALEDVRCPVAKAKAKSKRRVLPKQAFLHDITMPKRPRCTAIDPNSTIVITLYKKEGTNGGNNGKLYLQSDYLDWLLSYAADELHFQGIQRTSPEPDRKKEANCTAVADVRLEWEFSEKAWEAEFVSGPFTGTSRRFCVADLTTKRWVKLRELSVVQGDLSRTMALVLKNIAKDFITRWCQAITTNIGDDFENEWGLEKEVLERRAKKRRGADDQRAAVAERDDNENCLHMLEADM